MTSVPSTDRTVKLCMDCKHFRTRTMYQIARVIFGANDWCDLARCAATAPKKIDLVCGRVTNSYDDLRFCDGTRREGGPCGPTGELWVAK